MESGLNGERAKKRGAERLQSPERLSLSGGVWGEEPQKTNAKPVKKQSACFRQSQELPKATRALRAYQPKHGKKSSSGPQQQQEPQSGASSEGKLAKAWKSPLPARSSKSREGAGCEVICFARSYLHQGGKPVFSTPLPSRGNRQFFAAGFPADCLRGCRVPVAHNQGTDRSGSVEHSAFPKIIQ